MVNGGRDGGGRDRMGRVDGKISDNVWYTEGRVNAKWTGDWWVGGEEDTERWAGWLQIDKKSMSGQICRH